MAAPLLRRYKLVASATAGTGVTVVPAVAAGRALVISKLIVVNQGTSAISVGIYVGSTATADFIAASMIINPGEVYTESGLVALAGEIVGFASNVANIGICSVHGEEVDN